ncbi:hypothetical protein KH5H1_09480 [Corallococcus caeni]|uniref:Tetratricopeptide repeat protein n=1 Tax=Corallococcus caeni TaxID=3082388 RepID=A0ABQ6QXA0_9BACT|nr:hypothetical protein KH5H1_09480 [Corallococcus sp. KH5-1]GMU08652.1 hypothetical protein ASNO1_49050 [Corallococcus sp. NO1]
MRIPTLALSCLLTVACAHPPATAPTAAEEKTADLPTIEAPSAPMAGWTQARRASALIREEKYAEALSLYEQARAAGNADPDAAYSAACAAARLGKPKDALDWLSHSVQSGFRDVAWMKQDGDLAPLRDDPAFVALAERMPTLPEPHPYSNEELKRLFAEDQADRQPPPPSPEAWKKIAERDAMRLRRARELLDQGALKEGADFLAAGFIFQHGDTQEDYALARRMGAEAAKRGHPKGLWLAAAAWDRWLMNANRPQRFGTQYKLDPADKVVKLYPVDPSVTDEERARWGFPPLAEIPTVLRMQ